MVDNCYLSFSTLLRVLKARAKEILEFLPEADDTFAYLGSLKYKYKDLNGVKFDITTLRRESGYQDSRHPNKVVFVKELEDDLDDDFFDDFFDS